MEEENKHGKVIRISFELYEHICKQISYPESFSDCLERVLKIKKEGKNAKSRNKKDQ